MSFTITRQTIHANGWGEEPTKHVFSSVANANKFLQLYAESFDIPDSYITEDDNSSISGAHVLVVPWGLSTDVYTVMRVENV